MKSNMFSIQIKRKRSQFNARSFQLTGSLRPGLMMTELIVAMILLAVCMSVLVPGLGWSLKQRRLSSQRQIAQLELVNQLEFVSALPWENVTTDRLNQLAVSPEVLRQLPGVVLSADLATVSDPIESRVVRLTLEWKMVNGAQMRPVELSTVIYRREKS